MVTVTDAVPVRLASGSVAVSVSTTFAVVISGRRAVQLVGLKGVVVGESAYVWVGRPLKIKSVWYGIGVCGRPHELESCPGRPRR